MKWGWFPVLSLSSLALVGCGQHIGLDIDSVTAARGEDDHVEVRVGVQVSVTGDPGEAKNVEEVCVEAKWAEEAVGDGGTADAEADGGAPSPGAPPLPTGPTLFSAKTCTQERFEDREVKVLTIRSAEPIPKQPLLITVSITASAPRADLGLVIRDGLGNQVRSP